MRLAPFERGPRPRKWLALVALSVTWFQNVVWNHIPFSSLDIRASYLARHGVGLAYAHEIGLAELRKLSLEFGLGGFVFFNGGLFDWEFCKILAVFLVSRCRRCRGLF
jgi:hypothetical protein